MTIYVDDMRMQARVGNLDARWSHMWSDTSSEELVAFAISIGLQARWVQNSSGFVHFDLTDSKRNAAIAAGAIPVAYGDHVKHWEWRDGRRQLIK